MLDVITGAADDINNGNVDVHLFQQMKPPPQVLYSLQYIKSRMLQPEDVIYGIIELGSNLGFLALGIVMVLLEGGRAVLTNGSRLVRVRFASTAVGGKEKERLVILGSGWGGYNVARYAVLSLGC